jgi:small-conductance mechanosensitive channel
MESADRSATASQNADDPKAYGHATEQRIAWLTLAFGAVGGAAAALSHAWSWAAGLVIGAALAWFNFRWLRHGVDALVLASAAQAGAEKRQLPPWNYGKAAFRYVLIGLAIYVIFEFLKIPFASMVLGLCALGAATTAASVYEIWCPEK